MKERDRKKKKRTDDRAARMELSDHFVPEETTDDAELEARIRRQMSGVGAQLKRDDPDEMDEVYEQLRMDVTDEASEDDYEDESESEELLRRMPWLKYTAPEVLERASNRSYQYRGRRAGRERDAAQPGTINPYAGEAFKEAVDELRVKIMEAKESAEGEVKRTRGKVYVPPMRESAQVNAPQQAQTANAPQQAQTVNAPQQASASEEVVTFKPEPKPERMPPFYVNQAASEAPEATNRVDIPKEVRFEVPASAATVQRSAQDRTELQQNRVESAQNMSKDPGEQQQPVQNRVESVQNVSKDPAAVQMTPVAQTATLPPVRRPVPQAPPAGPVPFTSSALFRTPEGLPAGDKHTPEGLPADGIRKPEGLHADAAQIDPAIKEDIRAFKQGIIDLDDDADIVERMREKLENERFEAEEALAEEVLYPDGAEEAFDRKDPVTDYAPEKKEEKKKQGKTLSAMERLKALAQTDEVEDESVKGRRPKMTALDRLEQMEALDRQGIPYAAQHRVGEAGFQGMQMQQMQQMQMRPMMPMPGMNPAMNPAMMGVPMQGMNPAMNPAMMGMPMPGVNPAMMGAGMNPAMMGQTMPLPQLPPMPPFAQGMPQQVPQPQQAPQGSGGFDYNVSQGGGFDF